MKPIQAGRTNEPCGFLENSPRAREDYIEIRSELTRTKKARKSLSSSRRGQLFPEKFLGGGEDAI